MEALVYLNGKISAAKDAKVSVMDRGFLFGDGVYESGRTYERCFLYLEEHWERLRRSAEKLLLPIPWSDGELTQSLYEVARAYPSEEACFRTIVTRGMVEAVGLDLLDTPAPTLVHILNAVPDYEKKRKDGIFILTSKIIRNSAAAQDPNIKTSNYLNSLLACQDVKARGSAEGVMCDGQGNVTEGTNFSIFGVTQDDVVITPGLEVGILDSITRRHVLDLARPKFKIQEGFISLAAFQACREVFIVSSNREILPVKQWDEKHYPIPAKITSELIELLTAEMAEYVRTHPKYDN